MHGLLRAQRDDRSVHDAEDGRVRADAEAIVATATAVKPFTFCRDRMAYRIAQTT